MKNKSISVRFATLHLSIIDYVKEKYSLTTTEAIEKIIYDYAMYGMDESRK